MPAYTISSPMGLCFETCFELRFYGPANPFESCRMLSFNLLTLFLGRLYHLLIVLGFNDTSTLVGHFVSSPREREKRDRRDSRGDERDD